MTREQAKQFLINLGIEEPTDDAISSYLNSVNGEVNKEKEKSKKLEEESNKAKELQRQLDELNKQNMSDIELANKERDDALSKFADLQAEVSRMKLKNSFAEQGIIGEDADKLIESMKDGSIDVALLGKIISAKNEEAVNNKVAELSQQTIQPNGGLIDKDKQKTVEDKVLENISSSLKSGNVESVIDAYK